MKKIIDYINTIGAIITIFAFFGIVSLTTLLNKFKAENKSASLIYFGITVLSITILGVMMLIVIYNTRLKNNKAYLIEKYLDKYIKGEGSAFLQNLNTNERDKSNRLIAKTRKSIKMLLNKGTTKTLEQDEYYMYLFSLLNGATKRIWAASIAGAEEWINTPEESEFLRLNILASRKKVLVERIFILRKDALNDFLENTAIKSQIDNRNDYLKTYIVIAEDLTSKKPSLLTDIGSGFLAFDDFAIATDVFTDNYIRGNLTLEEESISRNNRIFTNLRDYAKPLDKNSVSYFKSISN